MNFIIEDLYQMNKAMFCKGNLYEFKKYKQEYIDTLVVRSYSLSWKLKHTYY